jgi:hypothetical protein
MLDSVEFVKALYNSNIPMIAIENSIGLLSTRWRKPDQIIQPYMFGEEATKSTCFWLKNLPQLVPTNIVDKGEFVTFSSGKKMAKWYNDTKVSSDTKRRILRSKTFQGIADAIAKQWSDALLKIK